MVFKSMPALAGRHYRPGPAGRLGDDEAFPRRRVQGIHHGGPEGRENYTYGTWSCAGPGPLRVTRELLGERLREGSIYRLLADEGARIFPDDYFADLYSASARGRPTVPARVLATAMVLQAFEGLSDREACDRLEVDLRWQAAAGLHTGAEAFHPTVLPGQRNRLRASARPRRLFEDTRAVARQAGAMGNRVRRARLHPAL